MIRDEDITVYLFRQKNPTKNIKKLEPADKINIYIIFNSMSTVEILYLKIIFINKYKFNVKKRNGKKKKKYLFTRNA